MAKVYIIITGYGQVLSKAKAPISEFHELGRYTLANLTFNCKTNKTSNKTTKETDRVRKLLNNFGLNKETAPVNFSLLSIKFVVLFSIMILHFKLATNFIYVSLQMNHKMIIRTILH